jgi:hypothetical protein
VNLGSLGRQTGIRLNRGFRSAQAFTVEPRAVEAASASLDSSFAQRLTLSGLPIYVARFPAAPFPAASIEQALGKMTKPEFRNPNQIQSLRATGVMSEHNARAMRRRFSACARGEFEAS